MITLPLNYYAQFRDAGGNLVTGTDGQTWFAVGDVGTDIESVLTLNGSTTTSSIALNPLRFSLGTDTIDPAFLAAEASGTAFAQIELAGYSGSGSNAVLTTDDVFKDAAVSGLSSGSKGATVEVRYADTVQRFYPAAAAGQQPAPTVAGYDAITGQPDTSTNTAAGAPGSVPQAALVGTPPATATSAALSLYVQFRDGAGNVINDGTGQTWFAISGLSVPSTQTLHITGSGTGAGVIRFDPLSFTIDGTALPVLLSAQASGTPLGSVEVAGYTGSGATATLTEDFLDRSAQVASLAFGADGSQAITLHTTDLVQSVYPPAASGAGLASPLPVTDGWNRATNTPDTSTNTRAPLVGTPGSAPANPLTYYVQFRGANGALLQGSAGQDWFAASGVGYGSVQVFNASGTATGEAFDPLTLTLTPDAILARLFASQASGASLQQIELAGYDGTGTLVTDDAFKEAIATTDLTNPDGTASLAFGYEAFTQSTNSTGVLGHANTSRQGYSLITKSVDTSTNTADGAPGHALDAPVAAAPMTATAGGALTDYVQIRLQGGALLTGTGGKTWFAVRNAGFDTTQTLSTSGAGRVGFDPLSLTFGPDAALPTLLLDAAAAKPFQSVELAAYATNGAGATLVADDLFKFATIATDTTQQDGTQTLTVRYGGLLQTAYAPDAQGTPTVVASQGWNNLDRTVDDTTAPIGGGSAYALAAPLSNTPAAASSPGPLTYYVQFRSYNGSYVTTGSGQTWFAINGLSQETVQTLATGSQSSGQGAAKVVFDPASFTFDDPLLQPVLFLASCVGAPYESVEIAGYAGSGANATLVQDDILNTTIVASVQSGSDNSTGVTLKYGGLVQRAYTLGASGKPVLASTGGWNAETNAADTSGAVPVAPLSGTPADVASAAALTYFLELRTTSSPTPLTDSTGTSFLPVSGVSFTTQQLAALSSQSGGAGSGKVTFGPLTFTIAPDSVSSTLLGDLATGTAFNAAFLLGYDTDGPKPVQAFSDEFKLVTVKDVTLNGDGSETVLLEYGGLQETGAAVDRNGQVTATTPQGWESVKNVGVSYNDPSGAPTDSLPNSGPACYCPGTRIATPGGEVAVEHLAEGDLVLTADGRALPVVWIGRRSYRGRFVAGRRDILPVTIAAGALADGIPARDLTISPEHAMLIDGLLIPARVLVNGTTITQATRIEAVHYLHVELAQHEAVLAEGAASESFVDDDSRGAFHNAAEWQGRYRAGPALYCAPRAEAGYNLEAIRTRIARRGRLRAA